MDKCEMDTEAVLFVYTILQLATHITHTDLRDDVITCLSCMHQPCRATPTADERSKACRFEKLFEEIFSIALMQRRMLLPPKNRRISVYTVEQC